MRRRRHRLTFDPGGLLVFLLAFLIMGYSGWNLLQFVGPPIERWVVRPSGPRPEFSTPAATQTATGITTSVKLDPTPEAIPATPTPYNQQYVRVANTEGRGVYVRRTPTMSDRLRAWPDNTLLEVLEEAIRAEDLDWYRVKDPAGNVGFVPARYVVPASH